MIYLMRLMDVARCCFGLQVPFKSQNQMDFDCDSSITTSGDYYVLQQPLEGFVIKLDTEVMSP